MFGSVGGPTTVVHTSPEVSLDWKIEQFHAATSSSSHGLLLSTMSKCNSNDHHDECCGLWSSLWYLSFYPSVGIFEKCCRPCELPTQGRPQIWLAPFESFSVQGLLLSDRTPPSHLSLLFAEVFCKLSLDLSTGKFGHGLCTLDGADTICPCTGEDNIHLFQTSALWLGEQEIDGGNQSSIQNCKDDVCPPCRVKSVIGLVVEI